MKKFIMNLLGIKNTNNCGDTFNSIRIDALAAQLHSNGIIDLRRYENDVMNRINKIIRDRNKAV